MRRLIIMVGLWWLVGLIVAGYTIPTLSARGGPFGQSGLGWYHPYRTEYERMLYPTVRISSPAGTGSGVVIS
ncbi:MAG: hypothetical protein QME51_10555, partial [Planctomycetota bacterium]|nr:hypothetical protein [Planctomycetota bacterium]